MATFADTTKNPVAVPTGKTVTPFSSIVVTDPIGLTETVSVTLGPYYYSPNSDLGTLTDPSGGGSFNATTKTFTETALVVGTPTAATQILSRLVYTPPTLSNGTSTSVRANVSVNNFADPNSVIVQTVTPPAISGTVANEPAASGSTIRPFGAVQVNDDNYNTYYYNYSAPKTTAFITVTDAGIPTDADGLLSGIGLGKTGVGTYTITEAANYTVQSYLSGLVFTSTAVLPGGTRSTAFELNVKDTGTALSTDDKTTSVLVIGPGAGPPLIAGTSGDQTVTSDKSISPFSGVTISDTNANPLDSATLTVSGGGTLSGDGLIAGAPGVYTVSATSPTNLTSVLDKISLIPPALNNQPSATLKITLSVADGTQTATDTKTMIKEVAPPPPPVIEPGANPPGSSPGPIPVPDPNPGPTPPPANFTVADQTTGQQFLASGDSYTGPVAGIQHQYINLTLDSLNVTATAPNCFIHTGSGNDAINVSKTNGTNVLDGGTGSNFLVGGSGNDTFFVDDRAATTDIWSTISSFHAGDAATIYGVMSSGFTLDWEDNQGTTGYTGLTLHASAPGKAVASMTLVGYTNADRINGRLTVSFGNDPASNSNYMYVHGN